MAYEEFFFKGTAAKFQKQIERLAVQWQSEYGQKPFRVLDEQPGKKLEPGWNVLVAFGGRVSDVPLEGGGSWRKGGGLPGRIKARELSDGASEVECLVSVREDPECWAELEPVWRRLKGLLTQQELSGKERTRPDLEKLTNTEYRVGKCVWEGLQNKEIAKELQLEVTTVKSAITWLYKKLGVKSEDRLELGEAWRKRGINTQDG